MNATGVVSSSQRLKGAAGISRIQEPPISIDWSFAALLFLGFTGTSVTSCIAVVAFVGCSYHNYIHWFWFRALACAYMRILWMETHAHVYYTQATSANKSSRSPCPSRGYGGMGLVRLSTPVHSGGLDRRSSADSNRPSPTIHGYIGKTLGELTKMAKVNQDASRTSPKVRSIQRSVLSGIRYHRSWTSDGKPAVGVSDLTTLICRSESLESRQKMSRIITSWCSWFLPGYCNLCSNSRATLVIHLLLDRNPHNYPDYPMQQS